MYEVDQESASAWWSNSVVAKTYTLGKLQYKYTMAYLYSTKLALNSFNKYM